LSPDITKKILQTLKNKDKTSILEEFFLESLTFMTMKDREEEVPEAHRNTFDWILNQNSSLSQDDSDLPSKHDNEFVHWLQHDHESGVYWINGKAGSGKSTLMRYICSDPKITQYLNVWADGKPLTCAKFYFWTSGTFEQRSQAGLLRYLLHQLLGQHKDMIPWMFPEMWLHCQDTKQRVKAAIEWSIPQLMSGLQRFLERAVGKTKICLFIDGLDEFDGDQQAMVDMLKTLVEFSPGDVKACVSSRPWEVFENSFRAIPQLRLHVLTQDDISRYVHDVLNGNVMVRRILKKQPKEAEAFQENVIRKADGVFLWVTLALRCLMERISSGDEVRNLQETLNSLPTDLDDLFRHLLFDSRPAKELEEQSRIFQIIRAREMMCDFTRDESSSSITLYQLALADKGENIEIEDTVEKPADEEIMDTYDSMKDLLESRCAGLLVLHQRDPVLARTHARFQDYNDTDPKLLAESRVSYMHRTVRDFLIYSGAMEFVEKQTDETFDPHICLLRSHVLQLRLPLKEPERHRQLDDWWPDIILALTHARYTNSAFKNFQVELLNQFKQTLDWYWIANKTDPLDNWARNAFSSFERRMKFNIPYHYPFLSLATKFGLASYVEIELGTAKYPYKGGIPLLSYAVEFLVNRRRSVYPLSSTEMIEMLLKGGQDPNLHYQNLSNRNETPWLLTLKCVREADRRGWIEFYDVDENGTKRWVKIIKSFMKHGADPNALILKDHFDPAATALDVITALYEKYLAAEFKELLEVLVEKGGTARA
jgi:hypothetical protein